MTRDSSQYADGVNDVETHSLCPRPAAIGAETSEHTPALAARERQGDLLSQTDTRLKIPRLTIVLAMCLGAAISWMVCRSTGLPAPAEAAVLEAQNTAARAVERATLRAQRAEARADQALRDAAEIKRTSLKHNPTTSHQGPLKQVKLYAGHEILGTKGQMHSQVGQDWLVASLLGCKHGGYFVDLAANDAEILSNTLMLERDFGWHGICIEANSEYFYGLARRQCQLFIGAVGTPLDNPVTFKLDGGLGGIVGKRYDNKKVNATDRTVQLRTIPLGMLLDALHAPPTIDFFSLDVEGAETLVMTDFPWDRYKFMILTVERPKPLLQRWLKKAGYHWLRKNSYWGDTTWIHWSIPGFDDIRWTWANHPGQHLPQSCMGWKPGNLLP